MSSAVGSGSYFVGCLLGGILLSKVASSGIKSNFGRVRVLRKTTFIIYIVILLGILLLLAAFHYKIGKGYFQSIVFLIQLGLGASFVAINCAIFLIVSFRHRVKMFAITGTVNNIALFLQPIYKEKF